MGDTINLEVISSGLRSVKLLRCSVKDMFKMLAEGGLPQNGLVGQKEDKEKCLLVELQSMMNNINQRVRDLENACTLIAHPNSPATINLNLGNTAFLGQDPQPDKTLLYGSTITTYRWCDRLHEISAAAYQILAASNLKRSLVPFQVPNLMRNRLMAPRRPISTGFNINRTQVDNVILPYTQMKNSNMKIELDRPFGSQQAMLKITLDRVLKAVVVLRGLLIDYVLVKGFNEEFTDFDNRLDIWSESHYEVFRKITDHANSAMMHFSSPLHHDQALKSFFQWLSSYNTLFTRPCKRCECRLKNNLPPTWRDQRTLEAYHELCKV